MMNFEYHNPVRILFGKGQTKELRTLIPISQKILLLYGGGSIKNNGVYDQVIGALQKHTIVEFSGIQPNPLYETCMKAVDVSRKENVDFLLAVGGGSVLDAAKFIAAAACLVDRDPWEMVARRMPVAKALPVGAVLTLPATGSEMNQNSVISHGEKKQKRAFASPALYPKFAILDPQTTTTLSERYTRNGIVDAYVHVTEQYLTWPCRAQIQDRFAEAILSTLIEEGPRALQEPTNYDVRANIMWAATSALNGYIACGVPMDFATHGIGHEITAEYGLDHAQTLAIVLPGLLHVQRESKKEKLLQYGERVFAITKGCEEERVSAAIAKTEEFFRSLGQKTRLCEYEIGAEACDVIAERIKNLPVKLGEHRDIGAEKTKEILLLRV